MARTKVSAHQAAIWLIVHAERHGDCLTNLKLQKLLYYAQAWHLALYDTPLFDDELEAWVHGPVVPSVYREYKSFGWQPIYLDPERYAIALPEEVAAHLEEIYRVYGGYTGHQLELMSHNEDPWQVARGDLPMTEACSNVISPELMRNYYKQRLH